MEQEAQSRVMTVNQTDSSSMSITESDMQDREGYFKSFEGDGMPLDINSLGIDLRNRDFKQGDQELYGDVGTRHIWALDMFITHDNDKHPNMRGQCFFCTEKGHRWTKCPEIKAHMKKNRVSHRRPFKMGETPKLWCQLHHRLHQCPQMIRIITLVTIQP